jgi:hypothetical protein
MFLVIILVITKMSAFHHVIFYMFVGLSCRSSHEIFQKICLPVVSLLRDEYWIKLCRSLLTEISFLLTTVGFTILYIMFLPYL